jgi:hypothetical protein
MNEAWLAQNGEKRCTVITLPSSNQPLGLQYFEAPANGGPRPSLINLGCEWLLHVLALFSKYVILPS